MTINLTPVVIDICTSLSAEAIDTEEFVDEAISVLGDIDEIDFTMSDNIDESEEIITPADIEQLIVEEQKVNVQTME